jgi:antitoxin (DNA-binding transcriptional repressor) of toxin-antitoxin stability system
MALALAAAISLPAAGPARAQTIAVQLNGAPVAFNEASPLNANGSVLVPMRGVFEAMQAQVRFIASTNTIIATRGAREIQLTLGSAQGYVNGAPVTLSQPARSIRGSTFVPLRFVADALGARVSWNDASQTVIITDPTLGGGAGGNSDPQPGGATAAATSVILERVDVADPARIVVRENGVLRSYDMDPRAEAFRQVGSGTAFGPLAPIELDDLRAGEDVKLTRRGDVVSQVVAQRSLRAGRVRAVNGNRIVLDDGTTLTVSTRLRFFDATGRESTNLADLGPDSQVALYIRPGTNTIYAVSAAQGDVSAASRLAATFPNSGGNGNLNNNPDPFDNGTAIGNGGAGTGGANAAARITLVRHSANRAVGLGAQISVEVRGTPRARGTFDLSPRLRNLPLREEQAGIYRGTYVVKAGDDVLNSFVTARLTLASAAAVANNPALEDISQSRDPFTIDTIPPRLIDLQPRNGSVVTDARPTIVAGVDDVGGSGLSTASLSVTDARGQTFEVPMTVVPPSRATAVIDRPLSGRVTVRVTMEDAAGNSRTTAAAFNVQPRAGAIASVVHDARRPLRVGSMLTVDVQASQGGRATFDLIDDQNRAVAQRVPMTEVNEGRYRGTHVLQDLPTGETLRVRARFDDLAGTIDTLEATTPVSLVGDARAFSITVPRATDAAGPDVTIRGRGTPGALVDVTVTARGVRTLFGLIGYQQYQQVLETRQVQVDTQGNWALPPVALKVPKNVAQASYEVTAVQTDEGNVKSQPQTVTIAPAQ